MTSWNKMHAANTNSPMVIGCGVKRENTTNGMQALRGTYKWGVVIAVFGMMLIL